MHELSIAIALVEQVDRVARAERAERVERIGVSIGALSGIEPEALRLAFPVAAEGTLADGAELDLTTVPARARCRTCGHEWMPEEWVFLCPACGATGVDVPGGRDLLLTGVTCFVPNERGGDDNAAPAAKEG